MEYYGYAGQILRVDLSSGKIEKEPLSPELIDGYLGGAGMQYRLIYDLLRPGLDPFSPDAPVIVGTGPLTGTLAPLNGKVFVTTKSPALAIKREEKHFISFNSGGSKRFGAMMKNAGYDHVVITGRAKKPSYLKIIDDDIEICEQEINRNNKQENNQRRILWDFRIRKTISRHLEKDNWCFWYFLRSNWNYDKFRIIYFTCHSLPQSWSFNYYRLQ